MRTKTDKKIPEGFTVRMALMDCLPVLFFSVSIALLSMRLQSILFLTGAVLVILAGSLKVSWKFVLALAKRDIHFLNRQLRYLMPAGFLLMLIALIADHKKWSLTAVWHSVLSFPAILFFALMLVCMVGMFYFSRHLDGRDAHANWIEQGTNALMQLCFLLGVLFA